MENPQTPWPCMFTVSVCHEIGEAQKNNGGDKKDPTVSREPHGHGEAASQT